MRFARCAAAAASVTRVRYARSAMPACLPSHMTFIAHTPPCYLLMMPDVYGRLMPAAVYFAPRSAICARVMRYYALSSAHSAA